ncbi:MAG: glucose 1-dehydrogenase [Deltaproteobacteria bacterium]|nr:glucose 1-dehydrogenase [Deltaproteobacteria bacterium]
MELEGKVALVTGASSGIGRAVARGFVARGGRVALVARGREGLEESRKLTHKPDSCLVCVADVTDRRAVDAAIGATVEAFGRIDTLVNAAGVLRSGSIESTTDEDWHTHLRLNLDAAFYAMRAAIPHLKVSKGTIVNVSSVASVRVFPNVLAYCVSKAAIDQLTRCAAIELAPEGVRVNAVNPGVVVTNLHKAGGMNDEVYEAFLERSKTTHPLGRVGTADEIADAILFLASERAGWITGETLVIDGGRQLTCAR